MPPDNAGKGAEESLSLGSADLGATVAGGRMSKNVQDLSMGAFYEVIPESMIEWIRTQKMFFVATAPLSAAGHVNVSPKGGEYFGVLDNKTFWYMDLTGSGNETLSHLHEPGNGRITIMLNAYDGPPKIVRLWGTGRVLEHSTPAFNTFIAAHDVATIPGTRSIIVVDVHQVGSSCGFSVPYYDFKSFRPILNDFMAKKAEKFKAGDEKESMDRYWAYKNAWSMDGLPGMQRGTWAAREFGVAPIKKMVGPLAPKRYTAGFGWGVQQVVLIALLSFLIGMAVALYGPMVREMALEAAKERNVDLSFGNLTPTSLYREAVSNK